MASSPSPILAISSTNRCALTRPGWSCVWRFPSPSTWIPTSCWWTRSWRWAIRRTVIGEDVIVAVMRVDIVAVDRLSSKIEEIDGGGYGSHLAPLIVNLLLPSRLPFRVIAWIIVVKEHVRMRLGPPPGLKRPLSQIIGKCFEGWKLPVGLGRIGKGLSARIGRRSGRRAIKARPRSRRSWASRRGPDHRQQGAILILHAL